MKITTLTIPEHRGQRLVGRHLEPVRELHRFDVKLVTRRNLLDMQRMPQIEQEDYIVHHHVLRHPELYWGEPWCWEEVSAGLFQSVLQGIMQYSGLTDLPVPGLDQQIQEYGESEVFRTDLLIVTAFPYRLDELLDLDPQQYQMLLQLGASKMALMGISPEAILTPQEFQRKRSQQRAELEGQQLTQQLLAQNTGRGRRPQQVSLVPEESMSITAK